jgi:hypothetical protein
VALQVGPHLLGLLASPLLVLVGVADIDTGKMVKGRNVLHNVSKGKVRRNTLTIE